MMNFVYLGYFTYLFILFLYKFTLLCLYLNLNLKLEQLKILIFLKVYHCIFLGPCSIFKTLLMVKKSTVKHEQK